MSKIPPVTREEHFLARIAGDPTALVLEPQTRLEKFLQKIIDNGPGGSGDVTPAAVVAATAAMTPEQAAETRQNIGADTPETVTEWLDAHVDPDTGYVIDNSLTVDGAAADAKATGDKVSELKSALDTAIEEFAVPTQEAVDNWLGRHPEATTTVQDGSLTEAKFTAETALKIANVKHVYNVLNYNVKNTNAGDQSSEINTVISMCEKGDTVYLPNGKYRITNPIIIDKGINFICDGEIRCVLGAQGYGIVISTSYVSLNVRRIESTNNNSGCVQVFSNSENVQFVAINIDEMTSSSSSGTDAINITADSYSVYYCKITGKRFYGSLGSNAISFKKLSENVTIGDIKIYDVLITHYNNAIYAGDENLSFGQGNVNSIVAVNVGIEGNNNGFYFKNVRSPVVLNCRIAEQQANGILTFEGFVYQGYYSGRTPLKLLNIRFVNPKKVSEYSGSNFWHSGFFVNSLCYFADIDQDPKTFAIIDGGRVYTSPVTLEERDMTQ